MARTDGAALITEFPVARSCPFHPPAPYGHLQRECPVARVRLSSGCEAVLITRYEDVRSVLDDPRLSADETKPGYPFLYEQGFESPLKGTFMRTDGESHYRVRRVLSKDFTVRAAAAGDSRTAGGEGEEARSAKAHTDSRGRPATTSTSAI